MKKLTGKMIALAAIGMLSGAIAGTASATAIVGTCDTGTVTDRPDLFVGTSCGPRPNPEPAPLISIDYQLDFTFEGYLDYANIGQEPGIVPGEDANVRIVATDDAFGELLLLTTVFFTTAGSDTLQPGDIFRSPFSGAATGSGSVDPALFPSWYPPGVPVDIGADFIFELPFSVGDCSGSNPINCIGIFDAVVTASIAGEFTYNYEHANNPLPVPTPATLALVGLGLAGLGWKRRKA